MLSTCLTNGTTGRHTPALARRCQSSRHLQFLWASCFWNQWVCVLCIERSHSTRCLQDWQGLPAEHTKITKASCENQKQVQSSHQIGWGPRLKHLPTQQWLCEANNLGANTKGTLTMSSKTPSILKVHGVHIYMFLPFAFCSSFYSSGSNTYLSSCSLAYKQANCIITHHCTTTPGRVQLTSFFTWTHANIHDVTG